MNNEEIDAIASVCNKLRRIIPEVTETFQKVMNNLGPTVQTIADTLRKQMKT